MTRGLGLFSYGALQGIEQRLTEIERVLERITDELITHDITEEQEMSDLDAVVTDLETKVAANTDAEDSAANVLAVLGQKVTDLSAELANSGVDPAFVSRLQALGTTISDEEGKLSAAVVANTPADPAAAPTPAPAPAPDQPPAV